MGKTYFLILLILFILISCGKNQLTIHIENQVNPLNLNYEIYSGNNLFLSGDLYSNTEKITIGEGEYKIKIADSWQELMEEKKIFISSPPLFMGQTDNYDLYFFQSILNGYYEDLHLKKKKSPYIAKGIIYINKNLIIDPGVKIIFKESARLSIYGSIKAIGSKKDHIVLTSDTDYWQGIVLSGKNNILTYCEIKKVKYYALTINSSDILIKKCIIALNQSIGIANYNYCNIHIISNNIINNGSYAVWEGGFLEGNYIAGNNGTSVNIVDLSLGTPVDTIDDNDCINTTDSTNSIRQFENIDGRKNPAAVPNDI